MLQKSYEMQKSIEGEETINCASTLTLIANCLTKKKQYDEALDYIERAIRKIEILKIIYLLGF